MIRHHRLARRFAAAACWLCIPFVPAVAADRVPQLAEDGTALRALDDNATAVAQGGRFCEPGAKWLRLGFDELVLNGYDSLVIRGDGGASYTFEGAGRNGRRFFARALEGECVEVEATFRDPRSRYRIGAYQYGRRPLAETPVVVAGAGDLCDILGACAGTSDLIVDMNPTAVFTAGDNAYQSGSPLEFALFYAPHWGRFKELTSPAPGNHEYNTENATGYFDYFNGAGEQTGPAGDRSRGYYSWDVGEWHFIALNSMSGGEVAQDQLDWLDADLAANTKPCTAAYWHHPLVSVGNYSPGNAHVKPFWDRLYAAHADLALVGHDHNYQRYEPMTPDQEADPEHGLVEVLVGTGGAQFYAIQGTHPLLAVANDDSHGVLELVLTGTGYTGRFVHSTGSFTDAFVGACHNAQPPNQPPVAAFGAKIDGLAVQFSDASVDSDGTIVARAWDFGDGAASADANPRHVYAAAGTYTVTLTVTDDGEASGSHAMPVSVGGSSDAIFRDGFDPPAR